MFKYTKLTPEQLDELRFLTDTAKVAYGEEIDEYVDHRKVVGVVESNRWKINSQVVPLSLNTNSSILKWIEEYTGLDSNRIHSLHSFSYPKGSQTVPHLDPNTSKTVLFLLYRAKIGGRFIFNRELYDFEEGSVLEYDGTKTLHGVEEIKEGYRKVLVVWFGKSNNSSYI